MMAARSRSFLGLSSRFKALLRACNGESAFDTGRRALAVDAVVVIVSREGPSPEVGSEGGPEPYKLPRLNALGGRAVLGSLSVSTSLLV
jgi:hypothetical protein